MKDNWMVCVFCADQKSQIIDHREIIRRKTFLEVTKLKMNDYLIVLLNIFLIYQLEILSLAKQCCLLNIASDYILK
jgi:hypothetical protein